mgnify:CR=1 FL=1
MKRVKFWKIFLVMASVLIILVGCSEADKVNTNISSRPIILSASARSRCTTPAQIWSSWSAKGTLL